MQRVDRDQAIEYAFDARRPPVLTVDAGESFVVETWDASRGYFRSEEDLAIPARRPGFDRHPPLANPVAGPIFVRGAAPGDTLVVTIEAIEVGEYSWIAVGPGRGPLGDSARFPSLSQEYTTWIFRHTPGPSGTMQDGTMHRGRFRWLITPFVGTIGVAPEREVATTIDGQGPWGGNLDSRDVTVGHRLRLPVYHPGALLFLGDVHASQGDTEFTGTAAETCATVQLRCEVLRGTPPPFLRIEKPESLVQLFCGRPLEWAIEQATIHLIEWLIADYRFDPVEAYCLISTCPEFRIHVYQSCRLGKLSPVCGAEIPRRYLEPA